MLALHILENYIKPNAMKMQGYKNPHTLVGDV